MSFIRNAFQKFKADFDEVNNLTIPSPRLRSDSSSQAISDNESGYGAIQQPTIRHDLPPIPFQPADQDDSSIHESVSPLPQRSLFQSLQHTSNSSNVSIESGTSGRTQPSDSTKHISISGDTNSTDPLNDEFARVSSLLNTKKKRPRNSLSSDNSSVPSTYSTHSASSELSQRETGIPTIDSRRKEFAMMSALLSQKSTKPKGNHGTMDDFGQPMKGPIDLFSIASKSTNGHGVSSTLQVKEMSLSHSPPNSVEVVHPAEVILPFSSISISPPSYDSVPIIQPSIAQTSQSHDDSVAQTSSPTVINDDNDHHQHTSETPITTQPPPISTPKFPERETVPIPIVKEGEPLDKPSASPNGHNPPLNSTFPDSNPISPKENNSSKRAESRRKQSSANMLNSYLLNLVTPQVAEVPDKVEPPKTSSSPWRPPLRSLQRISEGESLSADDLTPEDTLARRMEELGRMRRMESRNLLTQSKISPETTSQRPSQPNRTTATSKAELRPQPQTVQEDSSDVGTLLREAYIERQKALQTQLDKALAELRDAQAENKRLTSENQDQKRSISQLESTLDEVKQDQRQSLTQIQNQLRDTTSSLTVLNEEKKGWQDKLDAMQHKLSAAERQVRCLDHLTRHKLESRQEAGYGPPKRRGLSSTSPASTDVIAAMRALNEEIFQTCVQLVDGLERTSVFSIKHKPQVQKVLGDHLTVMMEDQAMKTTSGYNLLLMQTVLEVFMTHWCSSIIDAFYPYQESFADLLVHLSSTQATRASGSTAICGRQVQIIQSSSTPDTVKFNQWVQDIIKELGHFLTIAGLRMKTQRSPLFSTKTLALVKVAYDLRTAMAEKDICGGLEVVIVPPDMPFQDQWMTNAHADPYTRKVDTDHSVVDFVAGTSGIGLQRKVSEMVNGQFQSRTEVELKPKVILVRALNVKS